MTGARALAAALALVGTALVFWALPTNPVWNIPRVPLLLLGLWLLTWLYRWACQPRRSTH